MAVEPVAAVSDEIIRCTAQETFGFAALRPGQLEVVQDVLSGRPVITVMPTGAGKSLCYQLPAVILGQTAGVTLVVSPLIALMKDQVDSLRARGIAATALTSAADPGEQAEILAGIRAGAFTLVYVAPERFRSPRFVEALAAVGSQLALLAIDEAHCISEWGHDFRPDYRRLEQVVRDLMPPRLIALTATATPEVRDDIAGQLHLDDVRLYVRGFDRPNLFLAVERAGGFADKAARLVDKIKTRAGGGVGLVYAATRKNAERYAEALADAGMRVRVYHAGLEDGARSTAQDAFMSDRLDAIVATNAFGMGVDKSDIRVVIHADLPRSPEAYYQEAGRGGRDGQPTSCVLLFNHSDARLQEFLIDSSFPSPELLRALWRVLREDPQLGREPERLAGALPGPPHASTLGSAIRILTRHGFVREEADWLVATRPGERADFPPLDIEGMGRRAEIERSKLRTMIEYAYYPRCRRKFILDYFGDLDWNQREQRCQGCDNCLGMGQTQEISEEQATAVRGLLCLIRRLSGRFGRTRLAALATGADDDNRFLELPERGILRGQPSRYVLDLLRALEGAGLVDVSRGEYPTVSITPRGIQSADGHLELSGLGLLLPQRGSGRSKKAGAAPASHAAGSRAAVAAEPLAPKEPLDPLLVDRLRSLRTRLAKELELPAYVVFSNKTLDAIARARPSSAVELLGVSGIGPNRLEAYGEHILAAVRGDSDE